MPSTLPFWAKSMLRRLLLFWYVSSDVGTSPCQWESENIVLSLTAFGLGAVNLEGRTSPT